MESKTVTSQEETCPLPTALSTLGVGVGGQEPSVRLLHFFLDAFVADDHVIQVFSESSLPISFVLTHTRTLIFPCARFNRLSSSLPFTSPTKLPTPIPANNKNQIQRTLWLTPQERTNPCCPHPTAVIDLS